MTVMNITFLLTAGLQRPAGLRYFPLAKELVRLGHRVKILALHPNLQSCEQRTTQIDGVHIQYVGQMHAPKAEGDVTRFGPWQLTRVVFASTLGMLREVAKTPGDVLHLGKPQPINGTAALLGGKLLRGRPLYLDCDDYEAGANAFSAQWQRKIFAAFEDNLPRFAEGITVNTTFLRERYIDMGYPARRIVYVPNGIDADRFRALSDRQADAIRARLGVRDQRLVAYVGSLTFINHRVDLLLQAFALVAQERPEAVLLLVGGGPDLEASRMQAQRLGVERRVIFVGRVSPSAAPYYLKIADVSVDPVDDDPVARARSPLKIFESMAVGTPVVTGDVGDRREILADGKAGLLVAPGDSKALAAGILDLLQDDDKRVRMGEAGLRASERYYWHVLVNDFVKVYGLS